VLKRDVTELYSPPFINERFITLINEIVRYLDTGQTGYESYTEYIDHNIIRYRIEFKNPIKLTYDRLNTFFDFLYSIGSEYRHIYVVDSILRDGYKHWRVVVEFYNPDYDAEIFVDYDRIETGNGKDVVIYVVNIYFEQERK
jgi:hypothetical protein